MTNYENASRWACDQVEEKIVDGKLDFPECTFADAVVHFSPGIEFFRPEGAKPFFTVTEDLGRELCFLAETNYEFFDLCRNVCATNLLADVELPDCLRIFAAHFLSGAISRPTPSNRPRKRNWFEQLFIWVLVNETAERFDLKPTRNQATRSKESACDALAEALTVCGRKTEYDEIMNLLNHRDTRRLRDEFLACIRIGGRRNVRGLDPDATAEARARETVSEILQTFPATAGKSPDLP